MLIVMLSTAMHAEDNCLHDGPNASVTPIPLKEVMGEAAFKKAMDSGKYRYVGSSKCRLCHREFFVGRKKDVHDFAMDSLRERGKEKNPKCLTCHSTGYGVKTGFVDLKKTPRLANVQCEGCHGPGNVHLRYGKDKKPGGFLAGKDNMERLKKMCKTCHTQRWEGDVHSFEREYNGYRSAVPEHVKR